jgi:hypothetical protein
MCLGRDDGGDWAEGFCENQEIPRDCPNKIESHFVLVGYGGGFENWGRAT